MKTKLFIFTLVAITNSSSLFAQDVINPYANYAAGTPLNFDFKMPKYEISSQGGTLFYYFNTIMPNTGGNSASEYMINFDQLWWFNGCNGLNLLNNHKKSYKIEVVGFPFVMPCAYPGGTGCGNGSSTRLLEMPTISLDDDQTGLFNNIWREKSFIEIDNGTKMSKPADLITQFYTNPDPVSTNIGALPVYPHTIHKITLYLHCGSLLSDDVVDSLVFLYDFTRGRMRDFPFTITNTDSGYMASNWDVTFHPRLIYKNADLMQHSYQETFNDDIYINGNTVNYYPFLTNTCSSFSDYYDVFSIAHTASCNEPFDVDQFNYIHPAPFCLTSYLPYQGYTYDILAGYDHSSTGELSIQQGIPQQYQIQTYYDFTTINPFEKIIYNPSEVTSTSTANNLIFPSGYTFKTIRGVYPIASDVLADQNDPQTGGLYPDEKFVPVRTDLRCENSSYPQAATPDDNSVYASMYFLDAGSKLSIEPCVQIYDATFEVRPGATLLFEDHPHILGYEDVSSNLGRYKILGIGGAVLRNYDDVQYVQNSSITQTYPLEYIAMTGIESGKDVDPDADATDGNYELQNGSDVTFKATDYIHLTDGFDVKAGSSFSAYTQTSITAPSCSFYVANGGGNYQNKMAAPAKANFIKPELFVAPNPANEIARFVLKGLNGIKHGTIFNAVGKTVLNIDELQVDSFELNVSKFPAGLYFIFFKDYAGNSTSAKMVVQ